VNFRLPQPPAAAAHVATDDVGAVVEFARTFEQPQIRVVHDTAPLQCVRYTLQDPPGGICWQTAAAATTIRGQLAAPTLHLIESGSARYFVGRRTLDAEAGDAVLVPANVEMTVRWQPTRNVAVQPPAAVIEAALRARRPRGRGAARIGLCRLAVDETSGAALSAALAEYVGALAAQHGSLPDARSALAAWIADAAVAAAAVAPVQALRESRAKRLEAWIESHLAEPISLERLCEVAAVGARCLQKTFEVRHGTSPLEFVMQRRLATAREKLLRAPRGAQVIDIALDVGVTHMGRFAQRYRAVFGELPSATLRQRHEVSNRASR
jgi:AraC-like DNA-binding protein